MNTALLFDGQNYVDLGTLGTLGSNLGAGLYIEFEVKTTDTNYSEWGEFVAGHSCVIVSLDGATGSIGLLIHDTAGRELKVHTGDTKFNDGIPHLVKITEVGNVVSISVDGTLKPIIIDTNSSPSTYDNFTNGFGLAARYYSGAFGNFFTGTIDNFKIGTSSGSLYASYAINEGTGTTIADTVGSHTGTFAHGAGADPVWVLDTALQFDGTNDLDITTLGSLGSNIVANGFYCQFNIDDCTQSAPALFGASQSSVTNQLLILFNFDENFSTASGRIGMQFTDGSGNQLVCATTATTNFNDGNPHTVEIFATLGATKTVVIVVDGVSRSINYSNRDTINSFNNLPNAFAVGAARQGVTPVGFLACTVDNFHIGTDPATLYGSYALNEGTGTTAADTSGGSHTGTLEKTSGGFPAWVPGIGQAPFAFTSAATGVNASSAVGHGNIGSDGGFPVTERGFVVSTSANPTTADTKVTAAGTTGAYTASITGLTIYTTYHYRTYAQNAEGVNYGADTTFFTSAGSKTGMMMGI